MNKFLNRKIGLMFLVVILTSSCVQYERLLNKEGSQYEAIENAIIDFCYTNKKEMRKYKVFQISDKTDSLYYRIDILPRDNVYSVFDSLGSHPSNFPTNYKYYKDKLFVWNDENVPLNEEILNVLQKHSILDSVRLRYELGAYGDGWDLENNDMPPYPVIKIDETLKSVEYTICKRNISKYGKLKTSGYIPPDSDKQPKVDCD